MGIKEESRASGSEAGNGDNEIVRQGVLETVFFVSWWSLVVAGLMISNSCAVAERLATKYIDGDRSLAKTEARETTRFEILPLIEGQKLLAHRVDLLAKESAHTAESYEDFNKVFKQYVRDSNNFFIMTEKELKKLRARLLVVENKFVKQYRPRRVPHYERGVKVFGRGGQQDGR